MEGERGNEMSESGESFLEYVLGELRCRDFRFKNESFWCLK